VLYLRNLGGGVEALVGRGVSSGKLTRRLSLMEKSSIYEKTLPHLSCPIDVLPGL
jgi:hypothetical protein